MSSQKRNQVLRCNSVKNCIPEMPVDVTATDTGDSADVCVLVERTVPALASKIVMKVKQFKIVFKIQQKLVTAKKCN